MVILYGLRSFTQIESLMENEKVLAALKEIDYNLRCAISKELTYINPERERGLIDETTLFKSNKNGGNDQQIKQIILMNILFYQ